MLRRLLLSLVLPLALGACGADNKWASDADVARAAYISGEPPSITLYTVLRKTGEGAHSGVLIDGSQRVLFDPAGTWYHPHVPERHDVHFGINDQMKRFYVDYHARETYDVVEQRIPVSREVADIAIRRVLQNGAVNKAFCGVSTISVLRDIPGLESLPNTFMPGKLMRAFGKLPGATYRLHVDGDPDDNSGVLMVQKDQG
jgi:hypothetical protein